MHRPLHCTMRVLGHLSNQWSEWLGLTITNEPDGRTLLAGQVADSAALYGAINRLRDLDLLLVELHVKPAETETNDEVTRS